MDSVHSDYFLEIFSENISNEIDNLDSKLYNKLNIVFYESIIASIDMSLRENKLYGELNF